MHSRKLLGALTPRLSPRHRAQSRRAPHGSAGRKARRFAAEALEDRMLLSADPGWTFGIGSSGIDYTRDAEIGPDGKVYVTGHFSGTVDFDPGAGTTEHTAAGLTDGFVAKYTPDQQLVWVQTFGGSDGDEEIRDLGFDALGNVYIEGWFDSTSADFGAFTVSSNGAEDAFVAKLDASGTFDWVRNFGGSELDLAGGLAIDSAANTYVGGIFRGTVDFDPGPGVSELVSGNMQDGFVLKLDTNANFQWVSQIDSSRWAEVFRVTLDENGAPYAIGHFQGTVDFPLTSLGDPVSLNSSGASTFILKLDTAGNTDWVRHLQSSGSGASRIQADGTGNVYALEFFEGTLSFADDQGPLPGAPTMTSDGDYDTLVSKWDTTGNLVWAQQITGPQNVAPLGVDIDAAGNLHVSGRFEGTVDFDPGSGTNTLTSVSVGHPDAFVIKLDGAAGDLVWVRQIAGPDEVTAWGLTVDASDNVYVAGEFRRLAYFPNGDVLTAAGESDGFLLKLDPAANALSAHGSGDVPKPIQDAQGKSPRSTFSSLTVDESFTIQDLDVVLDISHTWDEDLDVFLTSPTGTRVELFSDVGGSGDNFTGTVLDDEASTNIASASAPFTGVFTPEAGSLSDFDGENALGTWTLEIVDDEKFQLGTLNGWSIIATHGAPTPGITVAPTNGLVTGEDGTSDSFTVVLDTQPADDVTIGISSSDTSEGTPDVASLTFTPANWDTPQTVTVTGQDDPDLDGNVVYGIVTAAALSNDPAYNGLDPADVSVTNLDNEVPAGVTVTDITPSSMPADSSGPVTITGSGFAAGASVTFANGSGPAPSASNIVVAADGLSITATVTTHKKAKASSWDVVVTNPGGSSDACESCFIVTLGGASSAAATNVVTAPSSADTDEALATTGDTTNPTTTTDPLPAADTDPLLQPRQTSGSDTIDDPTLVDLAFSDPATLDDPLLADLATALAG